MDHRSAWKSIEGMGLSTPTDGLCLQENGKMDTNGLPPVPDEHLYDYDGICWWCGSPANSREHKWKRSEVTDIFGKGSYDSVVWVTEGRGEAPQSEPIRGPKAARLMFGYSLCTQCNGTRSQPFDHAYALFSRYLLANYSRVIEQRSFNLSDVYGADIENQMKNLARYYAKHIGCRIAEKAGRVPENLVAFLNGEEEYATSVYSEFGIRSALLDWDDYRALSLRDSFAHHSSDPSRLGLTTFKSGIGVGAIEFLYDVNLDPGRPNTGNGIVEDAYQNLWTHGEGLYDYKINYKPRSFSFSSVSLASRIRRSLACLRVSSRFTSLR